jgi:3-phosphoshikimate 1-carboxyvinyltransferase
VNRNLRQVKRLEGTVDIPSSFRTALRIVLPALFAEGVTVINNFPKCVEGESLVQFMQNTFSNSFARAGSTISITGYGSFTAESLPTEIDVANNGILMLNLLPLYLRRGGSFLCNKTAVLGKLDILVKQLDKLGFYVEAKEIDDKYCVAITPASPDSVHVPIVSADEVYKTALLYAMLNVSGNSRIIESTPLPDESEIILRKMKASITSFRKGEAIPDEEDGVAEAVTTSDDELMRRIRKLQAKKEASSSEKPTRTIQIGETTKLKAAEFTLSGDPLCAAPFLLAGLLINHSSVTVKAIEGSATSGVFSALRRMGAQFNSERLKDRNAFDCLSEPVKLVGRRISGELTADVGELLPYVAVAAAYAEGQTVIRDADFLRNGERDIISLTLNNLRAMGTKVGEIEDGFVIEGAREHDGAEFETGGVPAVGMAFAVAAMKNKGESIIHGAEAVDSVFPDFFHRLEGLVKEDKGVFL